MPGPAPKNPSVRARRNDMKKDFRVLSLDGRRGALPPWPLQPDVAKTAELEVARDKIAGLQVELEGTEDGRTKGRLRRQIDRMELAAATLALQIEQAGDAERALWADLWGTPQAVIWDEAHAGREVAQYVRWKIRAEQGDIEAAKEARMLSDRLGLNPLALLRLRAEVERTEEVEDRGEKRRTRATTERTDRGKGGDPRGVLRAL